MFTGIVQAICPVKQSKKIRGILKLTIALDGMDKDLKPGASVAVNGVCLTVTGVAQGCAEFDVISETLAMTNLSQLKAGSLVNIERSFRVGDEVGGHLVSGHVTGRVRVDEILAQEENRRLTFCVPQEIMPFLIYKGFVALNGASLTISALDRQQNKLSVSLIPETLQRTTFGSSEVGNLVNIEVDNQTRTIVETVKNVMSDSEWIRGLGSKS